MTTKSYALAGLFVAPAIGVALGVWAEFADLGPPVLLAIATPAIIVSTLSAGYLLGARPIAFVLIGGLIGLLTFTIAEGGYLALHYARGGSFEDLHVRDCCHSAAPTVAMLLGIHVGVGATLGLAVGAGAAVLVGAGRAVGKVRAWEPRLQGPDSSLRSE